MSKCTLVARYISVKFIGNGERKYYVGYCTLRCEIKERQYVYFSGNAHI